MDTDMEIEEEFFINEPFWVREFTGVDFDFDIDYEFDAPKYHDFTRQETGLEAQEADFWFDIAPACPPSPFVLKVWGPNYSSLERAAPSTNDDNYTGLGLESDSSTVREIAKAEVKSPVKPPVSKHCSFMNPTASQLAKKKCWPESRCPRLLSRLNKLSVENEVSNLRGSSVIGIQATKRQKLDAGYLHKVARLKHQALFLHKEPKKVDDNTTFVRPKATIPREPMLRTAYRAERHRSKLDSESDVNMKSNASCSFKARPLNRKILEAPSLPLPRKSTPQQPDFQIFHLRTSQRAMQHSSVNGPNIYGSSPISQHRNTDSQRVNSNSALKEKSQASDKFKPFCLNEKEPNSPTNRRFQINPPVESFNKLSLASEVHSDAKPLSKLPGHYKDLKENAPDCLNLEHEMTIVAKSHRLDGNHCHCRSDQTIRCLEPQINISR